MNFSTSTLALLLLSLSLTSTFAHEHDFRCIHDEVEKFPIVVDPYPEVFETSHTEAPSDFLSNSRTLQTVTLTIKPRPITFKIVYDYGLPTSPYIKNLVTSAADFMSRLLKITDVSFYKTLFLNTPYCSVTPPTDLQAGGKGFNEDVLIFVAQESSTLNYVASGQACAVLGDQTRPYVAKITFNEKFVYQNPTNPTYMYNQHLAATIHEFIHCLGFSPILFPYFPNPDKSTSTKMDNGFKRTYYKLRATENSLQEELVKHFNCPDANMAGLLMEQQGTAASASAHLERRIFAEEIMTANILKDAKLTNVTLKFMENTGWYKVNYDLAANLTYGKGKGCGFYEGPCFTATGVPLTTPEYCKTLKEQGCHPSRKQGSVCGYTSTYPVYNYTLGPWNYQSNIKMEDMYGDNCPTHIQHPSHDCEDPKISKYLFEYTGRDSRCFVSTLYSSSVNKAQAGLCLKSSCVMNAATNKWTIQINLRSTTVTCTAAGKITKIAGYKADGWVECPDPETYCKDHSLIPCRFNCFGRGTCDYGTGKCTTCEAGWTGEDCGMVA